MKCNRLAPGELTLGTRLNARVPEADQIRQRAEVEEILSRLQAQPGVILADEVGMGKTFVALAVAYQFARANPRGPVVVMAPANLIDKWEQDLTTFCDLYLDDVRPRLHGIAPRQEFLDSHAFRYGVARHSVEFLRLLDDSPKERCHLILLAQGAMSRSQTDKWIRLALIAQCLRSHARRGPSQLIKVKKSIHRFLAELLRVSGIEKTHDLGEALWQRLLRSGTSSWKKIYNENLPANKQLGDDPVPKSVARALGRSLDLKPLAEALKKMPLKSSAYQSQRINDVRAAFQQVEQDLWSDLLAHAHWRSPLLIMDEAHHLKNPGTSLAKQLQSPDLDADLRTGEGALASAFDRMLFLTATPFQLGHHELVSVLRRFGDVRWDEQTLGAQDNFQGKLNTIGRRLDDSQRAALALQRSWARLQAEDCLDLAEHWWERLLDLDPVRRSARQRAVVDAYRDAIQSRLAAQQVLQPWIVRHNKGAHWVGTAIARRQRFDGAAMHGESSSTGLAIPPQQLLPFFLAARSAVEPGKDLLGEALCSSYEAFRETRNSGQVERDESEGAAAIDLTHSRWYLTEFDRALERCTGLTHPKIHATVSAAVDLWEAGEKVLVFAFYRKTCRALRIHISREIERRLRSIAEKRLGGVGAPIGADAIDQLISRIQQRYFDNAESPGRRALDAALREIVERHESALEHSGLVGAQREQLFGILRRFLRVPTTLIRCFPIGELDTLEPAAALDVTLNHCDGSGVSWRRKFDEFLAFITERCGAGERALYLDAADQIQTGGIRVDVPEGEDQAGGFVALANVQEATGLTARDKRSRLMRAFNTPFFPDILVCSEVMGEGVDLQRHCRHVIHHDLDWNPSTIEQRTGRVDRLGCKSEGRQSIHVYLPYLSGAADERQYRVMSDRERWFRVVMGQSVVAELIAPESPSMIPLPTIVAEELNFDLSLGNASANTPQSPDPPSPPSEAILD